MRVQPGLVGAEVLHGRVAFEDGLGAVAVVHVEIDDGDALQPMPVAGVGGGHGDIVEQAKPIDTCAVAWWPGGRTTQKAVRVRSCITASTAAMPAPAARRAAAREAGTMRVSTSSWR